MPEKCLMDHLELLNQQFAIPAALSFSAGSGKLPMALINNQHASAAISLSGGHVTEFRPHGQRPVLWMSEQAIFAPGKALRGGIPICWPWFGKRADAPNLPAHGFARNSTWQVTRTAAQPDGATLLELTLKETPDSLALWPHAFELRLSILVGDGLSLTLTASNPSSAPYTFSAAEHSYFAISDYASISLQGYDGLDYLDLLHPEQPPRRQRGALKPQGFHNHVYLGPDQRVRLVDPGYARVLHIHSLGSSSTVTWNPYIEGSLPISDLTANDYQHFFCVETAHTTPILLEAGQSHSMTQSVEITRL